jgi:hypothetical protein
MTAILTAGSLQNEASTVTIPISHMQRRIIQRVSYTHRIGWWRGNNTYFWVPGAYVDFRPIKSTSRIRFTYSIPTRDYGSAHMISHWIFYVDDIELGRHSRGGHQVENAFATEWDIEGWSAGTYRRIGYRFRSYTEANHNSHLYLTKYWDGGQTALNIPGQAIVEEYIPAPT